MARGSSSSCLAPLQPPRLCRHLKDGVRDAAVGERHAHGEAVQLALELWEDERDGGGAARAGGREVDEPRAARRTEACMGRVAACRERQSLGEEREHAMKEREA